jgi:DNA-binding HxlR family transcriptional regulator
MLKVTADSYEQIQDCPFRNVLDIVGDKWSFLVFAVLEDQPRRFNEIKRLIGDISQRVLTRTLRDLERDGYVSRKVYPVSPPRVEYELTQLGKSLLDPVKLFMNWAAAAYPEIQEARKRFDSHPTPHADERWR